jgi:hypothetical protein
MIITVKSPDGCPLRAFVGGKFLCCAKNNAQDSCGDAVNFPDECPLHARTVIIQKEDSEAESDVEKKSTLPV